MPDRRWIVGALAAAALGGCGEDTTGTVTPVAGPITSWVAGQPSLTESARYLEITVRAAGQAERRYAQRHQELVLIAALRLAAKRHARDAEIARYREARRLALERYRAELRRAKIEKARQLAELRRAQRERAALLARMRKAREVTPGEECSLPEVRAQFDCSTGHIPLGEQK